VYAYFRRGGKLIEFTRKPLFPNSNLHNVVRLHDKVVGRTKLNKTQRNIGLLIAVLKVMMAVLKVMSYNL
jgi:hypothetical protein